MPHLMAGRYVGFVLTGLFLFTGCATLVPTPHGNIKLYPPYDYNVTSGTVTLNPYAVDKAAQLLESGSDKVLDRLQKLAEKGKQ